MTIDEYGAFAEQKTRTRPPSHDGPGPRDVARGCVRCRVVRRDAEYIRVIKDIAGDLLLKLSIR